MNDGRLRRNAAPRSGGRLRNARFPQPGGADSCYPCERCAGRRADRMLAMMPFAALALGTSLITVAGTAGVPKLNVEPSCKAAGVAGMIVGRTADSCINDENAARDQLSKDWGSFSASDKSHCLSMVETGGGPSYVELLSCLEMSRDAKKIAKEPGSDTAQPAMAPHRRKR